MRRKLIKAVIVLLIAALAACLPGGGVAGLTVLPALKSAGLQGQLIFIHYSQTGNQLVRLDLAGGQVKVLFAAPDKSWLASADLSPDGKTLLLAYAPPPPAGQIQLGNTDLYRMPADGSAAPAVLLARKAANESFFHPAWGPDGQAIYYTHNVPTPSARTGIESDIERLAPGGQPQTLAKHALWPRPSPDGAKVAYLAEVLNTTDNILSIMNADGSAAGPLPAAANIRIVDDHLFSPDGQTVYFSALSEPGGAFIPSGPDGLWALWDGLGARPVSAHTNPEDWFRAGLTGGTVTGITHIAGVNMAAAFSPDGQWIAFLSQKGVYVMKPDGSALTQIASGMAMGSINWLK